MKCLFVLAHPDDEIDVGGTIYKWSRLGYDIAVAIMVGKANARRNLSDNLFIEEQKSMNILGVSKVYHADFPNIKMNTVEYSELAKYVEKCILDWKANIIVTHHSSDVNIDHVITSKVVIDVLGEIRLKETTSNINTILFCESAGATEWALDSSKNRFLPNYYVEITKEELLNKLEAHNSYVGVPRNYPHPYSKEAYKGLAYFRGSQCGFEYAEAYKCVLGVSK